MWQEEFLKSLCIPEESAVFTLLFHICPGKKVGEQARLLEGTLKISWFLLLLELLYFKGVGQRVWLGFCGPRCQGGGPGGGWTGAASPELRAPWPVLHASFGVLLW